MTVAHSWLHINTEDEMPTVTILDESTIDAVSINIQQDYADFVLTMPALDLMAFARKLFDVVQQATDTLGPECCYCHQRGINQGAFATPVGHEFGFHVGCREDYRHMADEVRDMERGEAWTS